MHSAIFGALKARVTITRYCREDGLKTARAPPRNPRGPVASKRAQPCLRAACVQRAVMLHVAAAEGHCASLGREE